ncbi:MAG: superoxide dismutase [Chlamydiia bacterium]|nr:superoxide dismutase [Chlamydiia bacterium]
MKKFLIACFFLFSAPLLSHDYQIKDFSYLLGRLDGIDDSVLKMHFTLYQGYVKNTNALAHSLQEMDDQTIAYGALKRRFAWEYDGMVLHELYFENLGGKQGLSSKSLLYQKIAENFGSFEKWRQNFFATGMIRGIGWVILFQDLATGQLYNIWVDEHNINLLAGGRPLLVMDVWEHAYITEYGLNRGGYIEAFYKNIDWGVVNRRFSK